MTKTRLGIRDEDYGKWDDLSEEAAATKRRDAENDLRDLSPISRDLLSPEGRLNYDLFRYAREHLIRLFDFRDHDYPVNQMEGWHTDIPDFLLTRHQIGSVQDAEAYIERLRGMRKLMMQVIEGLERRKNKGILPPKFVYSTAIASCRDLFVGAPFTSGYKDSTLFDDFKRKTSGLEDSVRVVLLERAASALLTDVLPAYQDLIGCLMRLDSITAESRGVWALPNGAACYAVRLLQHLTDGTWTPDRIHSLGESEVDRVRDEMGRLVSGMGHRGSLEEFFEKVKDARDENDPLHTTLYYRNDDSGRNAYLREVKANLDQMKGKITDFFPALPKSELEVKRVPPFREAAAPWGSYEDPPADGSGPGIYYVNLKDMTDVPKYELEVLAYHEALPGHHLQGSLAIERKDIPGFRKITAYNVVTEGWGLYAERLAKEMGFYRDRYSEFGRLSFELWRATRLVVDTGIHQLRWTKQQAIDYLLSKTPKTPAAAESAIERYMVDPGQATSYTIGMLNIVDLREKAKRSLGAKFDLKAFHDVVLRCGSVPSAILKQVVEDWVAAPGP